MKSNLTLRKTIVDKSGANAVTRSSASVRGIQCKLTISQSNDKYEQEADRVADQVVRGKNIQTFEKGNSPQSIQKRNPGNQVSHISLKQDSLITEEEHEEGLESKINRTLDRGTPLPSHTRNEMNEAFGADFSDVKIHATNYASNLSEQLQAKAFTVGRNIYFNSGQYMPESSDGKRLLAHELTHTIQQKGNQTLQRKPKRGSKKSRNQLLLEFLIKVDSSVKNAIEKAYKAWTKQNPGYTSSQAQSAYNRIYNEQIRIFRARMTDDFIRANGFPPAVIRNIGKRIRDGLKKKTKLTLSHLKTIKKYPGAYLTQYRQLQNLVNRKTILLTSKVNTASGDKKKFYQAQLNELKATQKYLSKTDTKKFLLLGGNYSKNLNKLTNYFRKYPLTYDKTSPEVQRRLNIASKVVLSYANDIEEQVFDNLKNRFDFNLSRIEAIFSKTAKTQAGTEKDDDIVKDTTPPVPDPGLSKEKIKKEERDENFKKFLKRFHEVTVTPQTSTNTYAALLQELRKMSVAERERFLEHIRGQMLKKGEKQLYHPKTVDGIDELRKFKRLSKLEKKILDTNKKLRKDSTNTEGKDIMIDLGDLIPESNKKGQTAQEALKEMSKANSVLNRIKKAAGVKGSSLSISPAWSPFLTELSLFYGLLVGASKRSTAIKDISKELIENLAKLRSTINKEILESAALALITAPGGPLAQAGALALKLKKIKQLIDTGQKVYDIGNKAKTFYKALTDPKLRSVLKTIDQKVKKIEELEEKLSSYNSLSSTTLEDELFNMEEQLRANLISFVAKKGDAIMAYLYIPQPKGGNPQAFIQELIKIIYDLPKGLSAFESMYKSYVTLKTNGSATRDDIAFLSLQAVDTGMYLYPFVGMLTQKANEALSGLNSKDYKSAFGKKKRKSKSGKKYKKPPKDASARKKDTKAKFAKLDRSKYDYDNNILKTKYLARYEKRFEKHLRDPKNGLYKGYWTPGYFKYIARSYYREIKADVQGETVEAKDKKTKRKVKAPAPLFKLTGWKLKGSQLAFKLKVNPEVDVETLTSRNLTYQTFHDAGGIPFTFSAMSGKNKRIRKKELRLWLSNNGYQFTYESDDKGNPLKGERNLHIRRGVKEKDYLHLDNGVIKQNLHTDVNKAYKNFFGKKIKTSNDLPEGYVLKRTPTRFDPSRLSVSKKRGLPSHMKPLHWDGGVLTKEAKTKVAQPVKALGTHSVTSGNYDWKKSIRSMFDIQPGKSPVFKSAYRKQSKDTIAKWEKYIDKHKDQNSKKRPEKVEVDLGYTINARAGGDKLSSYKLPEMKGTDDNGHIVARRFGAVEFYNNLVPMDSGKNQTGVWAEMEREIAQKFVGQEPISGNYVHAQIDLTYNSNETRRPSNIKVEWEEKTSSNAPQPSVQSRRGGNRKVKGSLNMSN